MHEEIFTHSLKDITDQEIIIDKFIWKDRIHSLSKKPTHRRNDNQLFYFPKE